MKKIVVYMPLFGIQAPAKTFKSFVDMILQPVDSYEIIPFIHTVGPTLDFNRNDAMARILDSHNPDFIMCVDADMVWGKDTIKHLLESIGDAGACTGLYWRKQFPHSCVVGRYTPWCSQMAPFRLSLEEMGYMDVPDQYLFHQPVDSFEGVEPVDVFGMGCVLLRADIFKKLRQPYFKYFSGYLSGDYTFPTISEDVWFCSQLKRAGIKVLADSRVKCGHLTEKIVTKDDAYEGPKIKIDNGIVMESNA